MGGFPIHPWLTFLDPAAFLAGFIVCVYYRRVSAQTVWLIAGFGAFLAPDVVLITGAYRWFTRIGFVHFLSPTGSAAWILDVLGMARLFSDLRIRGGNSTLVDIDGEGQDGVAAAK